tara:strand:+ start:962 stop:1243 length:282 start_codon:yes stop_codon:yes gene_type:complete
MEYLMQDSPGYLNNLANLDLVDNLDLLPTLAREDFSLMHLYLLPVLLDLTDNLDLDLVDLMEYLMQDNLVYHKVPYLHQQQAMPLRVDFSHYL